MQENALAGLRVARGGPVQAVPRDRVAEACQVRADLMCAPGSDADFEVRETREAIPYAIIGQRLASMTQARGHARAADGIAGDGFGDAAGISLHAALRQRQINLLHAARSELRRQRPVGRIRPGHQEDSAGSPVEPVHDTRPQLAADLR